MAGDTPGRECPHDAVGIPPQMGTVRMSEDRVPSTNIESPYGGRVSSLPGATGSLLPVKFPGAPVLLADGPQLGSWQVAVVRDDETHAGDASRQECPLAEQNRQRPICVSELHGGAGLPCMGEMLTSPEVTGNVRPVVPAGGSPLAGEVNPAGLLTRLVSMLLLGRCPHLTVTLLAQVARMSQGALSAQMFRLKFWNRYSIRFWTMLTRLASMLLLGHCPHLPVTLLAQLGRVSQGALLTQMIGHKLWNRSSIRF